MRHYQHKGETQGRLVAGVLILIAGLLFMFNNFGFLSPRVEYYVFSWKTLLIAIGVLNLLFSHNRTAGFILIAVGVAFWIPDIFELPIRAGRFIWPLAIIAVGLFLLFNRSDPGQEFRFWEEKRRGNNSSDEGTQPSGQPDFIQSDYLDEVAIFGGGDRIVTSKNFKGGRITAIFGGSKINMIHAKLAPGNNLLDVVSIFGGSEIIVPSDWLIRVEVVSIFGGYSDKRIIHAQEEIKEDSTSVLTIKGLALFGGGEIKSY